MDGVGKFRTSPMAINTISPTSREVQGLSYSPKILPLQRDDKTSCSKYLAPCLVISVKVA